MFKQFVISLFLGLISTNALTDIEKGEIYKRDTLKNIYTSFQEV